MKLLFTRQKSVFLSFFTGLLLICILIAIPTGYEDALIYQGTERAVGRVMETDHSAIITSGMIQSGEQTCTLLIENGLFQNIAHLFDRLSDNERPAAHAVKLPDVVGAETGIRTVDKLCIWQHFHNFSFQRNGGKLFTGVSGMETHGDGDSP